MKPLIIIPARYQSSRFPGKPLVSICGKPMLQWVWEICTRVLEPERIVVATDDERIATVCRELGMQCEMTSSDCKTGTDRVAEVARRYPASIYVNVQGDEPLMTGGVVDAVVEALENGNGEVATPVYRLSTADELADSNVVKAVRGAGGRALYFSRSPIPHVRESEPGEWLNHTPFWGHVGLYAYRRSVLSEYMQLPEGQLEAVEKLEQLRLLEAGMSILTVEIDYRPHAVDVPSDLEAVLEIMNSSANGS